MWGSEGRRWLKCIVWYSRRTNKKENLRSSKNIGTEMGDKMMTLENIILCERTRHNGQVINDFIYTKCPGKRDPRRKKRKMVVATGWGKGNGRHWRWWLTANDQLPFWMTNTFCF